MIAMDCYTSKFSLEGLVGVIISFPGIMAEATLKEYWPGLLAHYVSEDLVVASRGYEIVRRESGSQGWEFVARIPNNLMTSTLSSVDALRRLLRKGVRAYLQIDSERFLVFSDRTIFYWRPGLMSPVAVGTVTHGNGPLQQGCCRDRFGTCYYGEYAGNKQRQEIRIWSWREPGTGWRLFYSFPSRSIRHIHALQFDPFEEKIWVTTGDMDHESIIGYFGGSADEPNLSVVASGGQHTRAVSLVFTPEFVYWGTDAGKDTRETVNRIYRWSRRQGKIAEVAAVGGPVYYSTMDSGGRLYVSTVVEGSPSETDRYARVWMSTTGTKWVAIGRWRKDGYPRIFGYGVLSFPQGKMPKGKLLVVGHGVQGSPATWVLEV